MLNRSESAPKLAGGGAVDVPQRQQRRLAGLLRHPGSIRQDHDWLLTRCCPSPFESSPTGGGNHHVGDVNRSVADV
jgi:hypothetical protein